MYYALNILSALKGRHTPAIGETHRAMHRDTLTINEARLEKRWASLLIKGCGKHRRF